MADEFKKYVDKKVEIFKKDISEQIKSQIESVEDTTDININLDYSSLENDLIISHLKGYSDGRLVTTSQKIEKFDPFNMKFEKAIKSFMDKTPIMYDTIEKITDDITSNFLWLKKSNDLEITKKLFSNLQKNFENGGTLKEWKKDSEKVLLSCGLDKDSAYLETVYRTNIQTQQSIGNYEQMQEVVKYYPYWEYKAIEDNRTSDICRSLDGVIKKHDDPFWNMYYPPNHYNCRSTVICHNMKELKEKGLKVNRKKFDIDNKDFKGNPAKKYWDNIKSNVKDKQLQLDLKKKEINSIIKEREKLPILKETTIPKGTTKVIEKEFGKLNTDKVILFKERAKHIKERHPEILDTVLKNYDNIIKEPNYILKDSKNENTIWFMKELEKENVNTVVKLSISDIKEHKDFLNSIITSHKVEPFRLEKYLKKHKILYKLKK